MSEEQERMARLKVPEGTSRLVVQFHGPDLKERLGTTYDIQVFETKDLELAPRPEKEIREDCELLIKEIREHHSGCGCSRCSHNGIELWRMRKDFPYLSEEKKV